MSEMEPRERVRSEINRLYRFRELQFLQANGMIGAMMETHGISESHPDLAFIQDRKNQMISEIDTHIDNVTDAIFEHVGILEADEIRVEAFRSARVLLVDFLREPNRMATQVGLATRRLSYIDQKIERIQKPEGGDK